MISRAVSEHDVVLPRPTLRTLHPHEDLRATQLSHDVDVSSGFQVNQVFLPLYHDNSLVKVREACVEAHQGPDASSSTLTRNANDLAAPETLFPLPSCIPAQPMKCTVLILSTFLLSTELASAEQACSKMLERCEGRRDKCESKAKECSSALKKCEKGEKKQSSARTNSANDLEACLHARDSSEALFKDCQSSLEGNLKRIENLVNKVDIFKVRVNDMSLQLKEAQEKLQAYESVICSGCPSTELCEINNEDLSASCLCNSTFDDCVPGKFCVNGDGRQTCRTELEIKQAICADCPGGDEACILSGLETPYPTRTCMCTSHDDCLYRHYCMELVDGSGRQCYAETDLEREFCNCQKKRDCDFNPFTLLFDCRCLSADDCNPGELCISTVGVCSEGQIGDLCFDNVDCAEGYYCPRIAAFGTDRECTVDRSRAREMWEF